MKKVILLSMLVLWSSLSAFGQIAEPSRLVAKGYNLYDGTTKLDAATLEQILDFDAFTQYEKATRLKKIAWTLGGLGVLEGGIGTALILMEKKEGKITPLTYAITGVGAACLIAGIPCALIAQGKVQDIASSYNRQKKLAFTATNNGVGFVLYF